MTQPYSGLARVYDYLLAGIDYDTWADYLEELFDIYNVTPRKHIIDLACGTGNSSLPWARRGYACTGVDIAAEMLGVAREKARRCGLAVDFWQQDLRSLQLPLPGDVAVLYQDGLNYLLSVDDLRRAFRSIGNCVRPGGFFIFNLNMVEQLPTGQVPEVSFLHEKELTLVWESVYGEEERIWKIRLIAFLLEDGGMYSKFEEEHRERSHTREEVEALFSETGWRMRGCFKAFSLESPATQDRNIFYVIEREASA